MNDNTKFKKPNPFNHPLIQALLDIKRLLYSEGYELDNIDDILEELMDENNKLLRDRGSAIWDSHKFPDKSLKFIMSAIYDKCPQRFSLPLEEQALLGLMEHIQAQTSGGVVVKKGDFVKALKFTNTQRKNLQASLDHLTECGFLECIYRPPKGSKKPGVYKVNNNVSWIGNAEKTEISINVKNFDGKYKQTTETILLPNGKKMLCGTLSEVLPKQTSGEKKGIVAGNNNTNIGSELIKNSN